MGEPRAPGSGPESKGPPLAKVESVFRVAAVEESDGQLYYLGTPLAGSDRLDKQLWPLFREAGYEVRLTTRAETDGPFGPAEPDGPLGPAEPDGPFGPAEPDESVGSVESDGVSGATGTPSPNGSGRTTPGALGAAGPQYVLEAEPRSAGIDGIPWTNAIFLLLTLLSTLLVGTQWYYIQLDSPLALLEAWPFTAAILVPLAVHELGHYVMIRYHDVDASLPYFIPFPSIIGTMGAVIRMRGRIPDRKALFDIGVAGPLAGIVATVVVSLIGFYMDPITVPQRVVESTSGGIEFNYPVLLQVLQELSGQPESYGKGLVANPVIVGGWVGMLVTFLNLLPVGQFDGGHIMRAMLGPRQETVAAAVPAALFALAGYLYLARPSTNAIFLWAFWGVVAIALAYAGPADPIHDDPIGPKRKAVGVLTFAIGILCFTPVPFEIIPPA